MADWTPESRVEEILYDTINGEEYNGLPESRIEELLLELKEVIEAGGGGGGGTTNYNLLENKPQIGGVTLSGNKTLDELGLSTELRKVMDMITGQFSTESDYSEGDIVIHDKTLYVFTTDHTAGQWNDLEASQTTIEDLLSSIVPGASSLSDLTDTAIASPTNGQVLTYNSTTGKWENADGGETKDTVGYRFVTKSTGGHDATITVSKYLNGVLDSSTDYGYASVSDNPTIIDGYISFVYKSQQTSWEYTILKDSLSGHSVGYSYSWGYLDTIDAEEEFYISEDTLAGLNDVAIVSPTAAQPLTYDSTNDMWVNGGVIPAANGGTGNTSGYIRTGIRNNTTIGNRATAEGNSNQSSADDSHAEGASNNAIGNQSHAEGFSNTASGNYSHAEGANTTASGTYSHAEGMLSRAAHNYAHAEGSSVASAQAAHSEGEGSTASGFCSHAGGNYGSASGSCSFAHGSYTNATAECSVAMGRHTNAGYVDQFVAGKYNSNKSTSIFEIGNGTGDGTRSNAIEVDTNGNAKIAGGITAGSYIDDGYGHRLGFNKKAKINPFPEGASMITLYHENGITPISTSITDGVGMVDFNESQNGYEGFCIELNVTANTCYKVEFDYQNVDCQYWENQYTLGYQLTNTAVTDYANQGLWTNNIERTTGVQHFTTSITPTGTKVYLCFNVCAYSDARTNHATLSNLTVYELQEGTEDLSNYVQKSQTAGLLKNDGTVDTHTYVQTSNTAGLLKNDGTVDTTTYASEAGTESLINSTVGWTGKNQLPNEAVSGTVNTVVFTKNADGSITANGVPSANITYDIFGSSSNTNYLVLSSACKFTFGIQRDSSIMSLTIRDENDTVYSIADGETSISLPAGRYKWAYIFLNTSYSGTKTFYPMVYDARITDSTYEPYHKSVEECLEEINDKLSYLEQTVTLSTSASTTVTFTDSSITANSFIEYACSVWDLVPESITGAAGSCTIVLPKVDSAQSVTVRIYVR